MTTYFEIIAAFIALGAYVYGLFHWWYRYLTNLASRYDVPVRRKRAGILFPVVLFLFVLPVLAPFLFSVRAIPTSGLLAVAALFCSVAPGAIWWIRKLPSLSALGYGRQINQTHRLIQLRFSDSSLAEKLSESKPPEGVTLSKPTEVIEASAPAQILASVHIQFEIGVAIGALAKWICDALKEHQNKPIQINRKTVVVTVEGLNIFIQEQIAIGELLQKPLLKIRGDR